jgi:ABC-type cobalt transport system, ATPase component
MSLFTVNSLSYSADREQILNSVSFELEKGTLTILAGQNGSGKSVLLKCLKGLMKPTAGTILLNGEKLGKKERMKSLGLVFQDADLAYVGQTVEKDIAFGMENRGETKDRIKTKTEELIAAFELEKVRTHHPSTLSGGEKRKLAIAGVLAMDPQVLFLDEPLSNLDYPSTLTVLKALKTLKAEGRTVVVVSHEIEKMLALSDHLIVLEKGKIAFDGKSRDGLGALKAHRVYVPDLPYEKMTWLD